MTGCAAIVLSSFRRITLPYVTETIEKLKRSGPGQIEYYQAVEEVLMSLRPLLDQDAKYKKNNIIARIVEPERQILFRVA